MFALFSPSFPVTYGFIVFSLIKIRESLVREDDRTTFFVESKKMFQFLTRDMKSRSAKERVLLFYHSRIVCWRDECCCHCLTWRKEEEEMEDEPSKNPRVGPLIREFFGCS